MTDTVYIEDNVLFRMPASREYQFAALAVAQVFVEYYDKKMEINHVLPTGNYKFRLHYQLDMPDTDLEFFKAIGLELKTEPELLDHVDMDLDFTEDRVMQFFAFDRHVCQICGGLSGVQVNPAPKIRTVKSSLERRVLMLDDLAVPADVLMHAQDDEISCVVGRQSWLTYWSAAMGLPTIEIIDESTRRAWLSKWYSPVYRQIETRHINLLQQAIEDLEEVTAEIRRREEKAA